LSQFDTLRYLKYQATLTSTDNTQTPTISDVSACFNVVAPPSITKSFGAPTIKVNGTTTLTFNIQNPNSTTLTGLAFTDNLPPAMVVANPPNLSNSCGGTATAILLGGTVSLTGGTLAPSAGCTGSVDVQAVA